MERVGFQSRLLALLIDLVAVIIALHGIVLIDALMNSSGGRDFGVITIAGLIMVILANGLLEIFWEGTVGKRIMGLMIARDDGQSASRSALVKRWAVKQAPLIFGSFAVVLLALGDDWGRGRISHDVREGLMVFGVIDVIVGLVLAILVIIGCLRVRGAARQAFHDVIAGTAVYRRVEVVATPGFAPLMQKAVIPIDESPALPSSNPDQEIPVNTAAASVPQVISTTISSA